MNPILVSTNLEDKAFWFDSDHSLKYTVGKHNILWLTKCGNWVGRIEDKKILVCEKYVAMWHRNDVIVTDTWGEKGNKKGLRKGKGL